MPNLENWKIIIYGTEHEKMRLNGKVFGHTKPTCYDGMYINTSHIVSAKDEGETLAVQTRNTLYTLRKESICRNALPEDIGEFARRFLPESAEELAALVERKRNGFLESIEPLTEPNSLYLELTDEKNFAFGGAAFLDSKGELHNERMDIHYGMMEDSAILEKSGVRWFIGKGEVEFYRPLYGEPDEPLSVVIRNAGNAPINLRFANGACAVIKSGEQISVKREDGSVPL